jgi:cytidine deaminase
MTDKELTIIAEKAKQKSLSKYSHFRVGAALLTKDGKVFQGANIENASYSLTMCAERTALFTALLEGEREFKSIAITSDSKNFISPCGACRQVLYEHCGGDLEVIMTNEHGEEKKLKLKELLPFSFSDKDLTE